MRRTQLNGVLRVAWGVEMIVLVGPGWIGGMPVLNRRWVVEYVL